jgi:hypothetical protein
VLAVALAGIAAWLIVTGDDSARRVQIGVLVGIWGALIAAFCLFDARRTHQQEPIALAPQPSSTELELRSARTQLERAEEVAARRAHEARLEQLLRVEIQSAVVREVGALRAEIAELRSELLEKVGNQVRLERIETTRVIGSDLEALQQQVRRLQEVTSPAFPIQRDPAPLVAQVVEPAPAPEPPPTPVPHVETTGPIRIEQELRAAAPPEASRPSPSPSPTPEREAVTLPLQSDERTDTLSGLPRIEPFTAFELDPVESEPDYTGRRRRRDEDRAGADAEAESRGRRHRSDDDGDDLLARLLAREGR